MSITITTRQYVNIPFEASSIDENNGIYYFTDYKKELRDVSFKVSTTAEFLRAKNTGGFDYAFENNLIAQIISPLTIAPYNFTDENILTAINAVYGTASFTYADNYADIALKTIAFALNAKQFKGDEWYNSASAQSMKQSGAADALVRVHAFDGEQVLRDTLAPWNAPVDVLMNRWKTICIATNVSLRDLADGANLYFTHITNPDGNSNWWATEAWFRVPLQGYGVTHPNFQWAQYINTSLELSQQKQLGDQLMAAQKANGGDDWAIIGAIVSIGVMIATGGAGLFGTITNALGASGEALSAANAIIATENAIDVASVLSNASATVAAESQIVAVANQTATNLFNDAVSALNVTSQAVSNVANTIPLSDTAAQTFIDATQTLSTNANDIANVAQEAQNILDNHAQVIQDAINNVQNNTLPISATDLPINTNASMPDWTSGYDVPSQDVLPPRVPVTTTNIQSVADQIGKAISNITPTQAMNIATTAFKLVSGTGGQTGKPAVYAKQPGAPSTYDQFLQYYNSLTPENNYGIKGNISPLIAQIGVPVLILFGAFALSKGKAK